MATIQLTSEITVRLIQSVGGDAMVVAAARVSTAAEEALKYVDADPNENYGLIRYLMQHRHGTPFEHGSLTFFVHAPIFVFREWHRHRWMSFNEASARYKELEAVFWVPRRERPIVPVADFKSARPEFAEASQKQYPLTLAALEDSYQCSWANYRLLLDKGIAREVARSCLPVGIYSSCWVTCNPRSLMHFLSLRTHDDQATFVSYPQAEIEEAARVCEQVLADGWPLTYRAFCECGRVAP